MMGEADPKTESRKESALCAPRLTFVKMHGAGNDFIMVAAGDLRGRVLTRSRIAALCDRRRGVGADGLIVVRGGGDVDFDMLYYNADGSPAEMCGNGARCAVAFARDLGLIGDECRFNTTAGIVNGAVSPQGVSVTLPPWRDLRTGLNLEGSPFGAHHFVRVGVPHLVIPVDDVATVDVVRWGPILRHHSSLAPEGANVDWVTGSAKAGELALRTFERGVEGETQACGTGAAATAAVFCALGLAISPVALRTRGGDLLTVTVSTAESGGGLTLQGPAMVAFHGEVYWHD
jgi:diaminopimelate epimerase